MLLNIGEKIENNPWVLRILFILFLIGNICLFDKSTELHADENMYYYGALDLDKYGVIAYDRFGTIYNETEPVQSASNTQPGYVLYVYLLFKIFGANVLAVKYANILLLCGMFLLAVKLLKELQVRHTAICTTMLFWVLYPGWYYNTGKVLTEIPFTFLLMLSMLFLLRFVRQPERKWDFIIFCGILAAASYVRAIAIPIMLALLGSYVLSIFLAEKEKRDRIAACKISAVGIAILAAVVFPWLLRNYLVLGKFAYSNAGDVMMFWATLPYSIGVQDIAADSSWKNILKTLFTQDPIGYMKWRLFGCFQYMWGDVWDEHLVHPFRSMRYLLWTHYVIIVPLVASLGFFIRRYLKEAEFLLLAVPPVSIMIFNAYFSGLPRYVWPSIPFLFLVAGVFIHIFLKREWQQSEFQRLSFRKNTFPGKVAASAFCLLILYSVFVFPLQMGNEMQKWYQYIYYGEYQLPEEVGQRLYYKKFKVDDPALRMLEFNHRDAIYANDKGTAGLIFMQDIQKIKQAGEKTYTVVNIHSQGGYWLDYVIVYWKEYGVNETYMENRVYKFPQFSMEKAKKIIIPADVKELLIVPMVFFNGSMHFDDVEVSKYQIKIEGNTVPDAGKAVLTLH